MENEVLDFIKRRWKIDANWCNGNCYWFAYILTSRFPKLQIYYLPIEGHFIAGNPISKKYYDWNGLVNLKEKPISLKSIKRNDSLWYNRLIRDCVN